MFDFDLATEGMETTNEAVMALERSRLSQWVDAQVEVFDAVPGACSRWR